MFCHCLLIQLQRVLQISRDTCHVTHVTDSRTILILGPTQPQPVSGVTCWPCPFDFATQTSGQRDSISTRQQDKEVRLYLKSRCVEQSSSARSQVSSLPGQSQSEAPSTSSFRRGSSSSSRGSRPTSCASSAYQVVPVQSLEYTTT
jgi:hypothetical protein